MGRRQHIIIIKIIYNLGNIRLQIDGLDELRKFDIIYLLGFNIMLGLP